MAGKLYSKEEIDFILMNRDKMTYAEIGKILNRSKSSISNKIYELGLTSDGKSKIRNSLTKDRIKELYLNKKMSFAQIAKMYGTTAGNIHFIYKSYGLKTRNKKESSLIGAEKIRNKFDYDFFSKNSKESYYVLGLMATDGYISSQSNTIGITLVDKDVIENIKKLLNCESPIQEKTYDDNRQTTYTLQFTHSKTKSDLKKLGVTPRKSYTMQYPKLMRKYERYYIRGLFEGDGWFSVRKRIKNDTVSVGLVSASEQFVQELKNKLHNFGFDKFYIVKDGNCYRLRLGDVKQAEEFCKWLYSGYEDDKLFMKRKLDKVNSIINKNFNHQYIAEQNKELIHT